MTYREGRAPARRVVWSALVGVAFAMAAGSGCAVAPADDCTAKATCLGSDDVLLGEAGTTDEVIVSLDGAADGSAAQPSEVGDAGGKVIDAAPEGEAEDDAAGSAPVSCRPGYQCASPVPSGWVGPIALWQDENGALPPDCPPAYLGFKPFDMRQGLSAPPALCESSCVATGQQCAATVSVFADSSCISPCASKTVSSACSALTGCSGSQGTILADAPVPVGGICSPTVRQTVLPATWATAARTCLSTDPPDPTTCSKGKLCLPTPAPPFASRPCVAQIVVDPTRIPTSCPAAYPNGPYVYYWGYADSRGCSASSCTDAGPVGGGCGGTIALGGSPTSPCTTGAVAYAIGSGCSVPFTLPGPVSHVSANYTVVPAGSCSVGTPAVPIGLVRPSGPANVVCCL